MRVGMGVRVRVGMGVRVRVRVGWAGGGGGGWRGDGGGGGMLSGLLVAAGLRLTVARASLPRTTV